MERAGLKKRNISTSEAIGQMRKKGIDINEKDAEIILDFLYFLAKLTVNHYINNKDSR
jgi:hypothetical protein